MTKIKSKLTLLYCSPSLENIWFGNAFVFGPAWRVQLVSLFARNIKKLPFACEHVVCVFFFLQLYFLVLNFLDMVFWIGGPTSLVGILFLLFCSDLHKFTRNLEHSLVSLTKVTFSPGTCGPSSLVFKRNCSTDFFFFTKNMWARSLNKQ